MTLKKKEKRLPTKEKIKPRKLRTTPKRRLMMLPKKEKDSSKKERTPPKLQLQLLLGPSAYPQKMRTMMNLLKVRSPENLFL